MSAETRDPLKPIANGNRTSVTSAMVSALAVWLSNYVEDQQQAFVIAGAVAMVGGSALGWFIGAAGTWARDRKAAGSKSFLVYLLCAIGMVIALPAWGSPL